MLFYLYGVVITLMLYSLKWNEVRLIFPDINYAIIAVLIASSLSWFCVILFIIDIIDDLKN
nr:MAG TPA: hypothetical protein [Caudoviricetes sp.]